MPQGRKDMIISLRNRMQAIQNEEKITQSSCRKKGRSLLGKLTTLTKRHPKPCRRWKENLPIPSQYRWREKGADVPFYVFSTKLNCARYWWAFYIAISASVVLNVELLKLDSNYFLLPFYNEKCVNCNHD